MSGFIPNLPFSKTTKHRNQRIKSFGRIVDQRDGICFIYFFFFFDYFIVLMNIASNFGKSIFIYLFIFFFFKLIFTL